MNPERPRVPRDGFRIIESDQDGRRGESLDDSRESAAAALRALRRPMSNGNNLKRRTRELESTGRARKASSESN